MGWIIFLVLVVGGYLAWRNRDGLKASTDLIDPALLARVLGQDESRVRRQITRRDR